MNYDYLHKLFSYDPETGLVTRKITTSSRAIKGMTVGCKNAAGYLVVNINYKVEYLHRVIYCMMTGAEPAMTIDHVNEVPWDNRWENLRHVSSSANCHNRSVDSGVYFAKRDKVWVASITVAGVKKHIGSSKVKAAAERMYRHAKLAQLP
jgi:hypothetical protein